MNRRRAILALFLALPAARTIARDDGRYAQSPLKEWFDQLHSGRGPCCSDADGTAVSDADWRSLNDPEKPLAHYQVFLDGAWWDVPDESVITEPNRAGRTMVWPVYYRGTQEKAFRIEIRCFMPGSMT